MLTGLDHLPPSLNFWRHSLQWFGGLGIIVMALAVLPLPEIDPTARPVPASVAAPLGWRTAMSAFCLALVGLSAVSLAAGTYNPFIYFRF